MLNVKEEKTRKFIFLFDKALNSNCIAKATVTHWEFLKVWQLKLQLYIIFCVLKNLLIAHILGRCSKIVEVGGKNKKLFESLVQTLTLLSQTFLFPHFLNGSSKNHWGRAEQGPTHNWEWREAENPQSRSEPEPELVRETFLQSSTWHSVRDWSDLCHQHGWHSPVWVVWVCSGRSKCLHVQLGCWGK